jgi:hypothetical protein
VVWVAVFQRNILLASLGGCLKMEVGCFFGNSTYTRLFGVGAEEHNCSAFWIENEVMKWMGGGGYLVWYSSFGSMTSHTTFCRNKISFSHEQNFNSEYTALSDNIGGHLPINNLLRICRGIKSIIPNINLHFMLLKDLRPHSLYISVFC